MKNKKTFLMAGAIFFLLPFIVGSSIYLLTDVEKLKTQYPTIKNKEEGITWSKKRPWYWRRLNQISDKAKWAIILSEDWAFYSHDGIDFNQLEKAIGDSFKKGKLTRGASTISQQLVKNIFLTNERSLWRKFKEWIITVKLERNFKKRKILETYLNIIELGPNVYGMERASKYYFNKSSSYLTAREGAFLAMLLPSPVRYGESFRKKKLTKFALKIVNRNLKHLKMVHKLSPAQYQEALLERFTWEEESYDLADDDFFTDEGYEEQDKEQLLRSLKDLESEYEESSLEETPSDLDTRESIPSEGLESRSQKSDNLQDENSDQMPTESDDSQKDTFENDPDFETEENDPTTDIPTTEHVPNNQDLPDEQPSR